MVENKYYSIGEVIDLLQPGQLAISLHSETEEFSTVIGVCPRNWMWIKYPESDFAQREFGFIKKEGIPGKRLTIINAPENFEVNIEDEYGVKKKHIYLKGKIYEVEKEVIIKDDESEEN